MIQGILDNHVVQGAIVALLVMLAKEITQWIYSKVNHTALIDEYWIYLQPVLEAVSRRIRAAAIEDLANPSMRTKLVNQAVIAFIDSYTRYEGASPSVRMQAAAANEISGFIQKESAS